MKSKARILMISGFVGMIALPAVAAALELTEEIITPIGKTLSTYEMQALFEMVETQTIPPGFPLKRLYELFPDGPGNNFQKVLEALSKIDYPHP